MCWKQEWAMAINNLQMARTHIGRAQEKLRKRQVRNERNLQRLKQNPKYNYLKVLAPVEELLKKNRFAEQDCKDIIVELKERQAQLFCMIQLYGIKHSETPQRVYQLMGKYDITEANAQ